MHEETDSGNVFKGYKVFKFKEVVDACNNANIEVSTREVIPTIRDEPIIAWTNNMNILVSANFLVGVEAGGATE